MRALKSSQAGYAVTVIMAAISMMVVALPVLEIYRSNKSQQLKEYLAFSSAQLVKTKMTAFIQNDAAWARTLANNPNVANTLLVLYNADNTPAYDSSQANIGLNLAGNACDEFDLERGNDKCPFRYEFRFVNTNEVRVRFFFNARTYNLRSNISSYNLITPDPATGSLTVPGTFNRTIDLRDQKATCLALGGIYNQGTQTCTNVFLNGGCDAAELMLSARAIPDCAATPAQSEAVCAGTPGIAAIRFSNGSRVCGNRLLYAHP